MFLTEQAPSGPPGDRHPMAGLRESAGAPFLFPGAQLSATRLYSRDEVIFWEGQPVTSVYRVAKGAVRSCKFLGDGRRQIVAFHVVDEIFGLECSQEHHFSAEAINDASVLTIPRREVETLSEADPSVARSVVGLALAGLERAQVHAALLGRKLAPERVASFLLDMAERVHSDAFVLPMSRADIADYLGLTTETVSRTLCQFARAALIHKSAATRRISLRDKVALRRLDEGAVET